MSAAFAAELAAFAQLTSALPALFGLQKIISFKERKFKSLAGRRTRSQC